MGRQFVAMGMGMGIMPWRERWFWLRFVGPVGSGMSHGVVPFTFDIAFLVLAGT